MRSGSCICDQATKRRAFAADLLQMQQRATIDIIYGCDRWPPPYGRTRGVAPRSFEGGPRRFPR